MWGGVTMKNCFRALGLGLIVTLAGTACLPGAGEQKIGGTVHVLAVWGGSEQASFMAMVKPFEDQTGIHVAYEGTRDASAVLTTRLSAGNPPDVAGLPGPGQMIDWAKKGQLKPIDSTLDMGQLQSQYSQDWIKLGAVNGKQYGVFIKAALKGLVWYDPKVWAQHNFTVPKSWQDLQTLIPTMQATGIAPFCIAVESGSSSGWPATDWVENILLRQSGPDKYDQWTSGKLKFTSPEVKQAFQTFGQIVNTPGVVYGGKQAILSTNFGDGGTPLFSNPPKCYMHQQGSFMTDFFVKANPALKPNEDFKYFMFPTINPSYSSSVEVAGDLFGMFKDTPQARQLMKYLTTPQAQSIWVKRGGGLSPNKSVSPNDYPDPLSRELGQSLANARTPRFDASDLDPGPLADAYNSAMVKYINNPGSLDSILASLDQVQASSFGTS
jgi:alpha-glucoside transport system substrate-binding protein